MTTYSDVEERWFSELRPRVVDYISRQGVKHGRIGAEDMLASQADGADAEDLLVFSVEAPTRGRACRVYYL